MLLGFQEARSLAEKSSSWTASVMYVGLAQQGILRRKLRGNSREKGGKGGDLERDRALGGVGLQVQGVVVGGALGDGARHAGGAVLAAQQAAASLQDLGELACGGGGWGMYSSLI